MAKGKLKQSATARTYVILMIIFQLFVVRLYAFLDTVIICLNKNLYISKKKLPFKNVDGSINSSGDYVYFVLEKLSAENIKFWDIYIKQQEKQTQNSGVLTDKGYIPIKDGTASFAHSLDLWASVESDIWIAYATTKDPRITEVDEDSIEMALTVFMNQTAPITTHIGICRNCEYFRSLKQPHIGLSMQLHSFAAMAAQEIYGEKSYMVTNPTPIMRRIMFIALKEASLENSISTMDAKNAKGVFNTEDPKIWKIQRPKGEQVVFERPDWFGTVTSSGGYIERGHQHLLNQLPLVIIDLAALSSIFDDFS